MTTTKTATSQQAKRRVVRSVVFLIFVATSHLQAGAASFAQDSGLPMLLQSAPAATASAFQVSNVVEPADSGFASAPPLLLSNGAMGDAATPAASLKLPLSANAELSKSAPASGTRGPAVLIYAPPATQAYFTKAGIDSRLHIQAWEKFLRKYAIPFETTQSVDRLERMQAVALLLPSAALMSEREQQAVLAFRAGGGSVLATWQTGTRAENGEWRGYGFMEAALDVKVAGSTDAEEDDTFLMPYGDTPVSHHLPAGMRVWMERIKDWYPLRLVGKHAAAQVMDWSRNVAAGKAGAAMVFDERLAAVGKPSRAVVFGFSERLWVSADPKALEAIAHNALSWLLRLPDAHVAGWPHPFGSALVLAIDVADTLVDTDLNLGKLVGDLGGKASYHVLTQQLAESVDLIKKIKAQGHEVAFLGDRFDGFKDQSSAVQAKRLDGMLADMKKLGISADAGFHAPMESSDQNTERLLQERGFSHMIVSPEASAARMPYLAAAGTAGRTPGKSMVVLPRTQNGPDDLISEGDAAVGLKTFLAELDVADKMGGLSVVRVLGQSALTAPQLGEISQHIKARREHVWLATGGQVADWWRVRQEISASVDAGIVPPVLTVTIGGDQPMAKPAAVWINLPESGSALRLVAAAQTGKLPKTASVDAWRSAVLLSGLAPGEYRWQLYFDRPLAPGSK
ncbi:MAG: hypothetical protein H7315_06255 [Herminiimonas sp.]|nr:hypothetical protein [Herminiimonas sp.]